MRCFDIRYLKQMTEASYETIVLELETAISTLCDFLGLTFQPEMLPFSLQTHSYTPGEPREAVHYREPDPSRLTRWQTQLSTTEGALIEQQCAQEMSYHGYTPNGASASGWSNAALIMRDRPVFELKRLARRPRARVR